ncbi:hypothetical protein NTE19_003319 [Vibrio fluvialis]|nr:hypothetical protein [Vibrio fluvialis]
MSELTYNVVASAEFKVDVYDGENCDQHKPYIETWCDGDMETEKLDRISLDVSSYPPGTRIKIEVPNCPNCHLDADHQNDEKKCECGFDWKIWAEERYS